MVRQTSALHCERLVKTQLGFLVYLVDREWVQRTGQSLTGFTYRKSWPAG